MTPSVLWSAECGYLLAEGVLVLDRSREPCTVAYIISKLARYTENLRRGKRRISALELLVAMTSFRLLLTGSVADGVDYRDPFRGTEF